MNFSASTGKIRVLWLKFIIYVLKSDVSPRKVSQYTCDCFGIASTMKIIGAAKAAFSIRDDIECYELTGETPTEIRDRWFTADGQNYKLDAFRDNFNRPIDHFEGGLIVNRVARHPHPGGSSFRVCQGIVRQHLVIQVRKHRKIDQSQRFIATSGRSPADEVLSDVGGHHHAPSAQSHVNRAQRRQEVCQSGLPHPVAQIQGVAAIHQQNVRLLDDFMGPKGSSSPLFDTGADLPRNVTCVSTTRFQRMIPVRPVGRRLLLQRPNGARIFINFRL